MTLTERYLAAKRALFDAVYSDLNDRQREAVYTVNNPLLVLAGAGSGKTTVLVRRIAFLIRYGNAYWSETVPDGLTGEQVEYLAQAAKQYPPQQLKPMLDAFAEDPCPSYRVLAITFTNKAAKEICSRIDAMFADDPAACEEIMTGTFHSVCVRVLRRHAEAAGYRPGFSIWDTDDSKKAYSEALKRCRIDEKLLPIKAVANAVSRAKDRLLTPEAFEAEAGADFRMEQIARVYSAYQQLLRESNAVDFDDIIMQTVLLFRRHPEIADFYQKRFRYVCVDEYQDTNLAQFELTRLFAAGHRNLMVVGDDDQSIYRFRGATIENILSFDKAYPDAKVIRLEQNYRSTQNILDAANAVIAKNNGRMGKTLWTSAGAGSMIHLVGCEDQNDESRRIVDTVQRTVARGEAKYRDFAILYRMNAQSQNIEKAFARAAVPYRMLCGTRFSDRKEIRDAVAYLQLIANHDDNVRLLRIINEPRRKIGPKTLEAIAAIAAEQDCSQFRVIEQAQSFVALKNAAPMLDDFARLINGLTADAAEMRLDVLFDAVLDRSGYRQMLVDAGEAEAERLENLDEFKSQIIEYIRECEDGGEAPTLVGFLEETALVADIDRYDEDADAVVMMTVHSAKGLEFPIVFLPGMEDGIFPGMQTIDGGDAEMEEERRLAYVAITRAKKELYILHADQRLLYGRTNYNPVSRFVSEIPASLIDEEKTTRSGVWGRTGYGTNQFGAYGAQSPASQKKTYYSESGSARSAGASGAGKDSGTVRVFLGSPAAKRPAPAAPKAAPVSAPAAAPAFQPGDRVIHMVFGAGEILSCKKMGSDILYEVMFERAGTKKLMGKFAKLRKA